MTRPTGTTNRQEREEPANLEMNKRMMSEGVESRSLLEKSISRSRRLDAQKQLIKRDDDINRRLERLIKRPECREDDLLLSES